MARAYWKGYLRLSLVTCPIELFPATSQAEKTHFHQINTRTGHRLRQQMVAGLMPIVNAIRATGAISLEAIARALNDRGVRSRRGATWHVSSVMNLLNRSQRLAEAR